LESDDDSSAKKLIEKWQTFAPSLSNIKKLSYEINLVKYSSTKQLELLDGKDNLIFKINGLSDRSFRSLSTLINKNGPINGKALFYVNYGRPEDFAYLMAQKMSFNNQKDSFVIMRRQPNVISQIEQIHQAIHYGFGGLIFFDDEPQEQIPMTNDRHSFFQEWIRYYHDNQR